FLSAPAISILRNPRAESALLPEPELVRPRGAAAEIDIADPTRRLGPRIPGPGSVPRLAMLPDPPVNKHPHQKAELIPPAGGKARDRVVWTNRGRTLLPDTGMPNLTKDSSPKISSVIHAPFPKGAGLGRNEPRARRERQRDFQSVFREESYAFPI